MFDHWKQRLLLVCHARDYDDAVAALEHLAEHVRTAVAPEPEPLGGGAPSFEIGRPEDGDALMAESTQVAFSAKWVELEYTRIQPAGLQHS